MLNHAEFGAYFDKFIDQKLKKIAFKKLKHYQLKMAFMSMVSAVYKC